MTSTTKFENPAFDDNPIEPSKLEDLIDLQSKILGATVTSTNYEDLLNQVCLFAEKLTPDAVASIMLLDNDKNKLFIHAAPSIPEQAIDALNGLSVGDGSCGNAVFHDEDMYVCDTLTDNRWENIRSFAHKFKVHACWSSPVRNAVNKPIGSFALSSFARRTPDNFQRRLLNICASITGIIIQRENSRKELRDDREKLIESQQQYRSLVNNSGDAIFLHNTLGDILDINQMACDSLGYTRQELLTMTVADIDKDLGDKPDIQGFCENLSLDKTYTINGIHQTKNGTQFPVEVRCRRYLSGNVSLIVALARDISERKKHEQELLRARKLDSIGLLAGGIAHDFNNLLGIIQGYVDLASRSTTAPDKLGKYLNKATSASVQAADLTQQLLTFSKGGEPIKQSSDITGIIRQSADFSLHGCNIKVSHHYPDDLWAVDVDSGQISQVIQNLVINARQAMPDGGRLEISGENYMVTENDSSLNSQHEKYIRLSVKDTGQGIPEEMIESIFDPYFTTKEQGSGLGLALSYSIINKHNGHISVDSNPGDGTIFTIYLPASSKQLEVTNVAISDTKQAATSARIMIMDDDSMLREVGEEMLQNLGYEVLQATDGSDAIAQYQNAINKNQSIDLVIMDLTIPSGIGGKEAIRLIQKIDPDVCALVCSGYCNDPVMANHDEYGFKGALTKPYSQDELATAVSKILN